MSAPEMFVDPLRKLRMSAQGIADAGSDQGLAAETARFMRVPAQRFRFAVERLKQTSGEKFHPVEQSLGLMAGQSGQASHHGGPIDQRQAFFALKHRR